MSKRKSESVIEDSKLVNQNGKIKKHISLFKCDICDKAFWGKPSECDQCGKQFEIEKGNLKVMSHN